MKNLFKYQKRHLDNEIILPNFNSNFRLLIFRYHRVGTSQDRMFRWSYAPISPANFEEQIKYLIKKYQVLSLDDLLTSIKLNESLPNRTAILTFDDGYMDNRQFAFPILQKYNISATFFLTTGYISSDQLFWWDKVGYLIMHTSLEKLNLSPYGEFETIRDRKFDTIQRLLSLMKQIPDEEKNRLIDTIEQATKVEIPEGLGEKCVMTWEDVKEMHSGGMDFGAHTIHHPVLTKISLNTMKREIQTSKSEIEFHLKRNVTSFAYPFGKSWSYNQEIVNTVIDAGFDCAVTSYPSRVVPESKLYELPRVQTGSNILHLRFFSSNFHQIYKKLIHDL